jgi:hypothetical protein
MYDQIISLLNDKNKLKLNTKLKTDKDPLLFQHYINCIIKDLKKNSSQDNINTMESKYAPKKVLLGGVPSIHPSLYATENYTLTPMNETKMDIDFNTLIARPAIMGGCMATPLFNTIQQYIKIKVKGKGIKTSAITSVAGMATHRIMHCIEHMNKSTRLKKLK